MNLKRSLFSNIFLRNMLTTFGGRSEYSTKPGGFIPYFEDKIGPYQDDQYLYFPKEPFALRYKNEIFNKLHEYSGYGIVNFLDFHYASYPDSHDFLRFLHYEISERLKRRPNNPRLQSALGWVGEKREELQRVQEQELRKEIELGVQDIVKNQPAATPQEALSRACVCVMIQPEI